MIDMENVEKRVFEIYEDNMATFEDKIKKLKRKASKIGNGNIAFEIVGESIKTIKTDMKEYHYKMIHVVITGNETPVIAGWEFVATIKHYSEAGNILNKIPTFAGELPERFHKVDTICEHCGTHRMRKDTYILFNAESGEFKQIGKSCLKDFLGHASPEAFASYAEYLCEIDEEDWECVGSGCYTPRYENVVEWLAVTKMWIDQFGYVSRNRRNELSEEGKYVSTTSQEINDQFFPTPKVRRELEDSGKWIGTPSEEAREYARQAVEYVKNLEAKTEYERNLQVLVASDMFALRMSGYITSIIPYYAKAMEHIKAKEAEAEGKKSLKDSQHVGEIGKRVDFKLIVNKVMRFESMFGITKIHIMSDENGNQFVWKTTSATLSEGTEYSLKATIKDHTCYNGIRQTELTRAKVL